MKIVKWVIPSILLIITFWYSIDLIRFSDYDEKKLISEVSGDTLVLSELIIDPEASYKDLEVEITGETKITGLGLKTLFVNSIDDLKQGQKVRVWFSTNADNKYIAEKVVVYNLFNFH
ncbi:heme/copper-type cytochrome/quinol oxidase subunit 2 [Bacillus tianshenii]|uniref:Heme/copper-type cytochrome/quinol oxidase subunit 2 n=1 Tax=Sutcliffiella tianshenii TaxID=1463404 RepID=A0ABS2NVU6_9BACI|nr:DUF5666 domain-containing protein [Bacillus tianshenii]MBM7618771.1 heme/copper-type cytochrome/quinol oxidase subunit 2 [Bacillus tianshenii]